MGGDDRTAIKSGSSTEVNARENGGFVGRQFPHTAFGPKAVSVYGHAILLKHDAWWVKTVSLAS